ncbi:MAG: hypothetical protein ACTSSE_19410 [Candidatus Thorarchaeota archaeon]
MRYHLGRGENYKKWQIRNRDGSVEYIHPDDMVVVLSNARLHNRRKVADKIYQGENKTVCAWIDCEILSKGWWRMDGDSWEEIYYNPRETPYWTLFGEQGKIGATNLDNKMLDYVFIKGTEIYYK